MNGKEGGWACGCVCGWFGWWCWATGDVDREVVPPGAAVAVDASAPCGSGFDGSISRIM